MDRVRVFSEREKVGRALAGLVCERAKEACQERGTFCCALSGGSLVEMLAQEEETLVEAARSGPRWHLFLADERWCPLESGDSTWGEYKRRMPRLLEVVQFEPPYQSGMSLEEGAVRYGRLLTAQPALDLVILGVGPDGHTASIFPPITRAMLEEQQLMIPIHDSPKPPSERITLSLPSLLGEQVRELVFAVTGASKAEILRRIIMQRDESLPTSHMVGLAHWLVDDAAAVHLLSTTN